MCIRDRGKCLKGKSQNPNESLNNLIWSRILKRTFVSIETLKFRVFEAVLSYNDGYVTKLKILVHLGLEVGQNLAETMKQLDIVPIRKAEKVVTDPIKKTDSQEV